MDSGVRLDVWLWAARFHKTRSVATQAIEGGKIELNNAPAKAARLVHVDDQLRITRGVERLSIQVKALSATRGPAALAQQLYEESAESIQRREQEREMRRLSGAGFDHPPSRPDKHSRRRLRELKQG